MRWIPLWLALTAAASAQPLPDGAREDFCQIGRLDLDRLRVRVTPCGGLFGLEARGTDGTWHLLTSAANHNRRAALVDHAGLPQVAACGGGPAPEDWRFWHASGSYALVDEARTDGMWSPRWNRITSREPIECWQTEPWTVESDGFDSLTHDADPPAVHWAITLTPTEGTGFSRLSISTTCTRRDCLPGYTIRHFNNPSLCLGYSAVSHVSLDGGSTLMPVAQLAHSAADPASLVPVPSGRQVWIRCQPANRWLVLRFTEGNALRLYKHPAQNPAIIVVSPLVTNAPLAIGATQTLSFSLEIR